MATTDPNAGMRNDDPYRDQPERHREGDFRGVGERRYRGDYNPRPGPPPGRRGIFIDTEARRGFTTTEFWLTIIGVVALVIMAYNSDLLGVPWGMGMATAVLLAYILSRGLAKAGSDEVQRRNSDDF
jgi:hypothetical protein